MTLDADRKEELDLSRKCIEELDVENKELRYGMRCVRQELECAHLKLEALGKCVPHTLGM